MLYYFTFIYLYCSYYVVEIVHLVSSNLIYYSIKLIIDVEENKDFRANFRVLWRNFYWLIWWG